RGGIRLRGDGPGRALLDAAVAAHDAAGAGARGGAGRRACTPIAATTWTSGLDRDEYADRVTTVLELLRAGECYQVNLTRRLTCDAPIHPAPPPRPTPPP